MLTNQSVVVGQQGDLNGPFTFNTEAEDGISVDPNDLTEFPVDAPGGVIGIGGVDAPNVLASNGEVAVGGVFDEGDMKDGKGRIVLYMDIDWLAEAATAPVCR